MQFKNKTVNKQNKEHHMNINQDNRKVSPLVFSKAERFSNEFFNKKAKEHYQFMEFKNTYDGYKMENKSDSIISWLANNFGDDDSMIASYHPLITIKEIDSNLDANDIYDTMRDRVQDHIKRNDTHHFPRLMDAMYHYYTEYQSENSDYAPSSYESFVNSLSLMLYRSAMGIYMEFAVAKVLKNLFEHHPAFDCVDATDKEEKYDIDAKLVGKGKEYGISIKNLGAMSDRNIVNYREVFGKNKPVAYAGFVDDSMDVLKVVFVHELYETFQNAFSKLEVLANLDLEIQYSVYLNDLESGPIITEW